MKPQRLAHYCCRCNQVFHSTSAFPERCSLCGSQEWDKLKKYPNTTLFDDEPEEYDF